MPAIGPVLFRFSCRSWRVQKTRFSRERVDLARDLLLSLGESVRFPEMLRGSDLVLPLPGAYPLAPARTSSC